ncbi:class I SAM-dependent methyltransferase [Actinopolyspora sp. H202]|uniref:class I SAM-dependent methyltransferase n=1 Tax=Actinopolyspora sp. H202 TaxID=1500456 RepID=UPI003EE7246F
MTNRATHPEQDSGTIIGKLWERNYDPPTRRIIENLPIGPDWRCLDVGAGLGSMSRWLAERTPRGSVLAMDVDTSRLETSEASTLTVREADITTTEFSAESFELVLIRAVLSELDDPVDLLTRAAEWLSPGGWLVAEDFYFMPSEDATTPVGSRVIDGYIKAAMAGGVDWRQARRLPATLSRVGLESVDVAVRPLGPGQGREENELMRARMELQGQSLVDNGLVAAEDIEAFLDGLDRPEARDVTTLQFSAWGQRPVAERHSR